MGSSGPIARSLHEVLLAMFTPLSCVLMLSVASASPPETTAADSRFVSRLKAALLLETLNAELLSHESATLTLEKWCSRYGLGPPAVVAERVAGTEKAPTEEQRRELRVSEGDTVRYRNVRLRCGAVVLSEADNWYVPGRLTTEMNRLLDTTDAPFGRVVQGLGFRRHTISATVLSPFLPQDWATMSPARMEQLGEPCLPAHSLQHRAILTLPDGTPFSEVVETYTGNVLAIPALGLTHPCSQ